MKQRLKLGIALFTDRHLLETGGLLDVFVSRFGDTDGRLAGLPALPFEFGADRDRPTLRNQPPKIGEHSQEVLSQAGLTSTEINALTEHEVVISV